MRTISLRHLIYLLLVGVLPAACTLAAPISTQRFLVPAGSPLSAPSLVASSDGPQSASSSRAAILEADALPARAAPADQRSHRTEFDLPSVAAEGPRGWLQTVSPTSLLVEPTEDSPSYGTLPAASYVKLMDRSAGWLLVMFSGDAEGRAPGPAWVRASALAEPNVRPRWAKNHQVTQMWRGPADNEGGSWLPQWAWLELMGEERDGRLRVRTPGDGRYTAPSEGWVAAADLGPVQAPTTVDLPRAYPSTLGPSVLRLKVPYRTQLDATPWAEANCGPTVLSMVLEGRGLEVSSGDVRKRVLDAQGLWGHDSGVFMEALAEVGQQYGLRVLGLRDRNGSLQSWSVEMVRTQLQHGRPVILQVAFRGLPGRENALYGGDHFIVLYGLIGDDFLYHDPVDSDGPGFDRHMTAAQLQRAMNATDQRYAHAGIALG